MKAHFGFARFSSTRAKEPCNPCTNPPAQDVLARFARVARGTPYYVRVPPYAPRAKNRAERRAAARVSPAGAPRPVQPASSEAATGGAA